MSDMGFRVVKGYDSEMEDVEVLARMWDWEEALEAFNDEINNALDEMSCEGIDCYVVNDDDNNPYIATLRKEKDGTIACIVALEEFEVR